MIQKEPMILSDERQSYLVHLVVDTLEKKGVLSYTDRQKTHLLARQVMNQCMKIGREIDQKVCDKIQSLKRNVLENSSEWQVLYSNYLEEEMIRRGIAPAKEK